MSAETQNIENDFLNHLKKHQGIVHKVCYLYSNNISDKEDLFQEIILQLWKSYPSFKGKSAFSTWMYRVALNTAITHTKKWRLIKRKEEFENEHYDFEDALFKSEEIKILYKAIARLKKVERAVILLWLEDRHYQEIADMIGISVKNVSVRMVRIKRKLKEMIGKYH